jgi:hypothetical protein
VKLDAGVKRGGDALFGVTEEARGERCQESTCDSGGEGMGVDGAGVNSSLHYGEQLALVSKRQRRHKRGEEVEREVSREEEFAVGDGEHIVDHVPDIGCILEVGGELGGYLWWWWQLIEIPDAKPGVLHGQEAEECAASRVYCGHETRMVLVEHSHLM